MNSLTSSAHPVLPHSSQPQRLAFLLGISRFSHSTLFSLFHLCCLCFPLQQTPFCSCPFTFLIFFHCPCTLCNLFPVSRMCLLPLLLSRQTPLPLRSRIKLVASLENFQQHHPLPLLAETICTKIYLSLPTLGIEFEVTCCSVIIFY